MASQRPHQRGSLSISVPPSFAQQAGGQPSFSPALPTALQTQFRPSLPHGLPHPLSLSMQTPVHPQFFQPTTPFIPGHHQRGSLVGPINILPVLPNIAAQPPLTPGFNNLIMQQHQIPPHLANGQQGLAHQGGTAGVGMGHGRTGSVSLPFTRNRRQGSVSLGGPPKATLGGPANKHVAAPMTNPATSAAAMEKSLKNKKLVIKVPNERPDEGGVIPDFARYPVPSSELSEMEDPRPLDTATIPIYPEERQKGDFPKTVDVFLPGKSAWDVLARKLVDEKLKKLGLESNIPPPIFTHHNVHGRAASISSPADPNLLMFKLNKLQQHQSQVLSPNMTGSNLSVSPGPRQNSGSPSPNHLLGLPPRFGQMPGGHRHAMSLANPTAMAAYNPAGAFNPFGPNATLGSDQIISPARSAGRLPEDRSITPEESPLHAPRGIPGRLGSTLNKPDFIRGFGLDIAEETEEELEEAGSQAGISDIAASDLAAAIQEELDAIPEVDEIPSQPNSRLHSRHQSRISAALSLRSLGRGGKSDSGIIEEEADKDVVGDDALRAWESEGAARSPEGVHEWDASDNESIGEFSNPSDEERAREAKRARRLAQAKKTHIKGSNSRGSASFTHQGESLSVPHISRGHEGDSDDIVSNPSEDELYHPRPTSSRPLPAIPTSAVHSRSNSGQVPIHSRSGSGHPVPHSIQAIHSRTSSGQLATVSNNHTTPPVASPGASGFNIPHRDSLNPNARPFVFGKPWYSSTRPLTPPTPSTGLQPSPSSARLNAAAPEFKPSINAPEFRPRAVANEYKPNVDAPGFRPTSDNQPVQLQLPPIEFKSSGLTGAFKSNPGSGDFTFYKTEKLATVTVITPTVDQVSSEPKESNPPPTTEEPEQHIEPEEDDQEGKLLMTDIANENEAASSETQNVQPAPLGADGQTWAALSSFKFHDDPDDVELNSKGVDENTAFVFPPPKKSPITSLAPPVLPEIIRASSPEPLAEVTRVLNSRQTQFSSGITRSPKPPPLTELPRKEVDNTERPISSASASATSRALPQPPQRSQTLLDDFKSHPVSTNTVPASLFKNLSLANGESASSRRRSSRNSRDLFEQNHRASLDDIHMPMIARQTVKPAEPEAKVPTIVEKPAIIMPELAPLPRSATLPIPQANLSVTPDPEATTPLQDQLLSPRVDMVLDEKMEALRKDVRTLVESHLAKTNSNTSNRAEEALMRIARLMREQASERQDPNRLEQFSTEVVRSIVNESNKESQASIQLQLGQFAQRIHASVQQGPSKEVQRTVEEQASRVINAVSSATHSLEARLEAVHSLVEQPPSQAAGHIRAPSHESLLRVLRPHLEELRSAPFDVDIVTNRLAQAVKPTLADFIDLASDKGETADLIVTKLAPVLASMGPPSLDTQEIASQLAADINRRVPPVDPHVLTEQVADLVVERLDSRLAIRDKNNRPEMIAQRVTEVIQPHILSFTSTQVIQQLTKQEGLIANHQSDILSLREMMSQGLEELPHKLRTALTDVSINGHDERHLQLADLQPITLAVQNLESAYRLSSTTTTSEVIDKSLSDRFRTIEDALTRQRESMMASNATLVETTQQTQNLLDGGLNDVLHLQESSATQLQELASNTTKVLDQLSTIPDHLAISNTTLHALQTDILPRLRSLPDIIELQSHKLELQSQLSKARSSHGQVRSEKDLLAEKLLMVEAERDRLRSEIQAAKGTVAEKDLEIAASTAKVEQLDRALQQALNRVESSEAVAKSLQEQVIRLENAQRDLHKTNNERQAKMDSLEVRLSFAERDKECAQDALRRAEQERDANVEQQQESWRESRLMSQKLDSLTQLLLSKDSDELRDLRRHREKSKVLESELSSSKNRVLELESKMEVLVRSEAKAVQSLEDARQQTDEYEVKMNKLERELEPLRRLDDAQKTRDREFEQIRTQLQSQERQEVRNGLPKTLSSSKLEQNALRRENMSLQEEVTTLRSELEALQKAQATAKWQQAQSKEPAAPAYARAAPTVNGRSHLTSVHSSRSNTPPATYKGVYTSMHAPQKSGKVPAGYQSVSRSSLQNNSHHTSSSYRRATSPAQSLVSQAPTLQEDGWWT
ncbi:hypothetical protein FS842_000363 [Serendipita sp. 407]|nr:hypothetical protein FS842_000363 [Serendipita sp. 407]